MYSRAHLLIERDLEELANEPIDGILVFPLFEDNLFDIVAKIEGLPNTLWQSGIFQVYLKFNEFYNDAPPMVSFQTIPFHPNIDVSNGRPALDFLDDINKWKCEYTIKYILQSLQQLLANPLLDRAVNMDAVFMLKGNPDRYNKIAHESVMASQRIQKGMAPFPGGVYNKSAFINRTRDIVTPSSNTVVSNTVLAANANIPSSAPGTPLYSNHTISMSATLPPFTAGGDMANKSSTGYMNDHAESTGKSNTKRISFEDYFRLWKGIATSKATEASENIYIKYDLNQNPVQMAQHLGLTIKDLEVQMMQQLNDHKNLMYGKTFNFKENDSNIEEYSKIDKTKNQLKRINQMKATYLSKKTTSGENEGLGELGKSGGAGVVASLEARNMKSVTDEDRTMYITKPTPKNSSKANVTNINSWENEVDELVNWTQNLNEQIM